MARDQLPKGATDSKLRSTTRRVGVGASQPVGGKHSRRLVRLDQEAAARLWQVSLDTLVD